MRTDLRFMGVTALVLCSALALGACGSSSDNASSGGSGGASGGTEVKDQNKPPFVVQRDWGTFKLAPRIADRLKKGEKMNYVFSYQASGIALFSPQFKLGFDRGCADGQKIMSMNCAAIAPVQNNPNQQLSQIQAKLAANQIDCISIEPTTSDAMTTITNQMMDQGIPVFTVGVPSQGHEFTRFTQIPLKEGATAAATVLKWAKENNKTLKTFAVSGGDPTQFWAQGRMKSFREAIQKEIPGAKFVTSETKPLTIPYDPGKAYDAAKSFLSAHPDIDFVENVDINAENVNKAIHDLGRDGKVFSIGWNVSQGQLDGIGKGTQVAALDQRWSDQAAFGGPACATFLKTGKILPNTQELLPVTKANLAESRKQLNSILETGK